MNWTHYNRDGTIYKVDDRTVAEAKAEALACTREEAGRRIAAFAPIFKQLNAITDRLAAVEQALRITPPPDALALAADISTVRDICNIAEAAIEAAATNDAADSVRPAWPAVAIDVAADAGTING